MIDAKYIAWIRPARGIMELMSQRGRQQTGREAYAPHGLIVDWGYAAAQNLLTAGIKDDEDE